MTWVKDIRTCIARGGAEKGAEKYVSLFPEICSHSRVNGWSLSCDDGLHCGDEVMWEQQQQQQQLRLLESIHAANEPPLDHSEHAQPRSVFIFADCRRSATSRDSSYQRYISLQATQMMEREDGGSKPAVRIHAPVYGIRDL